MKKSTKKPSKAALDFTHYICSTTCNHMCSAHILGGGARYHHSRVVCAHECTIHSPDPRSFKGFKG